MKFPQLVVVVRGYSGSRWEGEARLTATRIKKVLQEASDRYRDHALAGDDMAQAGVELAAAVDRILIPAPCGLPRDVVSRAKRQIDSVDPEESR